MAKILLVEDDNNLREIYQARMQAEGYTVVTANDGEAALALAAKEKPDLIISDVMMPKISGFEMLDILRNTDGLKNTKVIMLTALGQAEDKTRADALGADKYLVKSQVTLEDIVNTARSLLTDSDPTQSAAAATPEAAPATPATPAMPAPVGTPTPQPQPVAAMPVATPPTPPQPAAPAPVIPVATPPVATAPLQSPTPNIPQPSPTAPVSQPATAQPAASQPPTTPTPTNTAAMDDNVVSSAVEQLLTSVNQPAAAPMPPAQPSSSPVPETKVPNTAPQPAADNNTQSLPQATPPPQPITSISGGNVEVAGKKVISPISVPDNKPTLDELLAKENGQPPTAAPSAADAAPAFTPPQPGASVTPQTPGSTFDPSSISL